MKKSLVCTLEGKRYAKCKGRDLCCAACVHYLTCTNRSYYCENDPSKCNMAKEIIRKEYGTHQ